MMHPYLSVLGLHVRWVFWKVAAITLVCCGAAAWLLVKAPIAQNGVPLPLEDAPQYGARGNAC